MRVFIVLALSVAFLFCFLPPEESQAERATRAEMELVCQNWLSYMVYQKGAWAGDTRPQIAKVDEIIEGDTILARCFSIAPYGYVVVPILKELPPIQAYSEEYGLDVNEGAGFPQLLREFLLDRIRLYAKVYGSLDAVQPPTGDMLLGRGHKVEWNRFLKSDQEFQADLRQGKFQRLTEVGPLLTTSWHQRAPYNYLCPRGDTTCIICPSGKIPSIPTVVGCVATATAQILKYWNWPPSGTGSHSYTWYGDYSCNGSTPSQNLFADYSDPYNWQNMPDSCDSGCAPQDTAALAELCYEVGVAFEMNYGVCGSGAYTADALTVFPTYFRYDPSIAKEDRYTHTAAEWFSIIQTEINNERPMQYRIRSHSIVCDGWRDTGGQNQYHMNYGWGGSFTTWFAIDSLYCYWVLPDSLCPPMEEYVIRNIMPLPPDSIPFAPAVNFGAGDGTRSVFCADLDGDTDLDLAVAKLLSDSVSIFMNNGDGTFLTQVDYGAGDGPNSVFCADLDGDCDLDLAVTNAYSDSVSILKNNGDGTYQTKVDYGAGNYLYSVFCADLDGDIDLDLAVANYYSGDVCILKNNGDGTFQTKTDYGVGDGPTSVFCADLDGDTDLDLAVADYLSDSVSILMNLTQRPGNSPPYPFPLLLPADGDTTSSTVEFDWANTQDVNLSDQIRYDLYVSRVSYFDPDSTDVYDSLTCSQFTSDSLHVDRYYWKVKAYDNWGAGTWSKQTWHFIYFIHGDANMDGTIELGDVVYLITYLYKNGPAPDPLAAGDVNCDGIVELGDVVYLISYLYKNGPAPPC